jgi:putative ABC transport system permease protein
MREAYRDVFVQGTVMTVSTGVAVLIACVGLFALAAFTAERRTKEIGVRKVMGASSADVVRLLLWQFSRPVLLANVIAWPAAYWAASHWLQGLPIASACRLGSSSQLSAAAVLIALITVGTHAWLAAQAKPAHALRYE